MHRVSVSSLVLSIVQESLSPALSFGCFDTICRKIKHHVLVHYIHELLFLESVINLNSLMHFIFKYGNKPLIE